MDQYKLDNFIGKKLQARLKSILHWSEEDIKDALHAYKQFIELKVVYDDWNADLLSPSLLVDQVWHLHVLDTRAYNSSCIQLCDRLIHHDPDGDGDLSQRAKRVKKTRQVYREHFGCEPNGKIWFFENEEFMDALCKFS